MREYALSLTLPSPPLGERDLKGCTVTLSSSLSPAAGERVA